MYRNVSHVSQIKNFETIIISCLTIDIFHWYDKLSSHDISYNYIMLCDCIMWSLLNFHINILHDMISLHCCMLHVIIWIHETLMIFCVFIKYLSHHLIILLDIPYVMIRIHEIFINLFWCIQIRSFDHVWENVIWQIWYHHVAK